MVVQAVYRRFVARPDDLDVQYRRSMFHRLSLAYMALGWTILGVTLYYLRQPRPKETSEEEVKGGGAGSIFLSLSHPVTQLTTSVSAGGE